jgi:pilus assembly protein CpaB
MDAKKVILLVVALIVAGGTAFMARSLFSQSATPQVQAAAIPVESGNEILVATRALPVGTIIAADSFRYQPWPKDLIENAYFLKGDAEPASLAGTVVRSAVTAGQPITKGSLVKPGERGFLAAALGPGMRAVTVSVSGSPASGVAGFVFPGDRVDLVLTQTVEGGEGPPLKASETIVRNLRVLATDQRTSSEDADGKKQVVAYSSVTLEATSRIAEKIAVAQSVGQLSLSLRSLAENVADLEKAIASGSVNVPDGSDPKAEKSMLLKLASQPTDVNPTYVTGGDVSRYQRRTVPKAASSAPAPAAAPVGGGIGAEAITLKLSGPKGRIHRSSNREPEIVSAGSK